MSLNYKTGVAAHRRNSRDLSLNIVGGKALSWARWTQSHLRLNHPHGLLSSCFPTNPACVYLTSARYILCPSPNTLRVRCIKSWHFIPNAMVQNNSVLEFIVRSRIPWGWFTLQQRLFEVFTKPLKANCSSITRSLMASGSWCEVPDRALESLGKCLHALFPLILIYTVQKKCAELYLHSPNTPSRHGA
jgi:hypothetical protein